MAGHFWDKLYLGSDLANLVSLAGATNRPVQFQAVAGTEYQIAVDGLDGGSGPFTLQLDMTPPNDDFARAIMLLGTNASAIGSNAGATREPNETMGDHGRSVWWMWTAPAAGHATLAVRRGSEFSRTEAGIYVGSALTNLTSVAEVVFINATSISFPTEAGTDYFVLVNGQVDSVLLDLRLDTTPPPANDNFAGRLALHGTNLAVEASPLGATREPVEPLHGGYPGALEAGRPALWLRAPGSLYRASAGGTRVGHQHSSLPDQGADQPPHLPRSGRNRIPNRGGRIRRHRPGHASASGLGPDSSKRSLPACPLCGITQRA